MRALVLLSVLWHIVSVLCDVPRENVVVEVTAGGGVTDPVLLTGLRLERTGDFQGARQKYVSRIENNPRNANAWHLLGLLELSLNNLDQAVKFVEHASQLEPDRTDILSNLGELQRRAGRPEDAVKTLRTALQKHESPMALLNLGLALEDANQLNDAVEAYRRAMKMDARHEKIRTNLAFALAKIDRMSEAIQVLVDGERVKVIYPKTRCRVHLEHGFKTMHEERITVAESDFSNAAACYEELLSKTSQHDSPQLEELKEGLGLAFSNLGGVKQKRREFLAALELYGKSLEIMPAHAGTLNNVGSSLWNLGHASRAMQVYRQAIAADPTCVEAYINLGVALYEQGDLSASRDAYLKAASLRPTIAAAMHIRIATLAAPILPACFSFDQCHDLYRVPIIKSLRAAFQQGRIALLQNKLWEIKQPANEVERVPFFWVYQGSNEYYTQARMRTLWEQTSPSLFTETDHSTSARCETIRSQGAGFRVGFISRFWFENHAHGQLLSGVIAFLRRSSHYAAVKVFDIKDHKGGPSREVLDAVGGAQNVITLTESLSAMVRRVADECLDLLIFADTMSEPLNHFLTFYRMAPVQAAFWGNPQTVGSTHLDYFISGDWMEPSCAAIRCSPIHPPHYHEQLVRLPGQAIHYFDIAVPPDVKTTVQMKRATCDPHRPVVFAVLQNAFKLHPAFDLAIDRILRSVPNSKLLMLEGSFPDWTIQLGRRFNATFSILRTNPNAIEFIPKVHTSDEYLRLLSRADIVLHPFPFGGSKTSADAIAIGLPLVVLKGAFLRGRMAFSFLHNIGIEELIAQNANEYVSIATRLAVDCSFRLRMMDQLAEKGPRIFNDRQVLEEWEHWASRAIQLARNERQFERETRDWGKEIAAAHASGDLALAKELAIKQLARGFADADARSDFGAILSQLGEKQAAVEQFREALRLEPGHANAANNLGVIYQDLGDIEQAEAHFSLARQKAPAWSTPVYNLGKLLEKTNRPYDALKLYISFLQLDNLSMEDYVTCLVLVLFQRGEPFDQDLFNAFGQVVASSILRIASDREASNIANNAIQLINSRTADLSRYPRRLAELTYLKRPDKLGKLRPLTPIALISQPFQPQHPDRRAELARALLENVRNRFLHQIHLLWETDGINAQEFLEGALGRALDKQDLELIGRKVVQIHFGSRLTFGSAVRYANQYLQGKVCILANADMSFDRTLARVPDFFQSSSETETRSTVIALARWEQSPESSSWFWRPRTDSQDSWFFISPLDFDTNVIDFELGRPRCDNRFAHLLQSNGFRVVNPSLDIISRHHHASSVRSSFAPVIGEGSQVHLEFPRFF